MVSAAVPGLYGGAGWGRAAGRGGAGPRRGAANSTSGGGVVEACTASGLCRHNKAANARAREGRRGQWRGPVRFKGAYKVSCTAVVVRAVLCQSAAMALRSDGLDELPAACLSPCGPPNPAELYSEERRLALEELVAGGPDAFAAFLRRERLGRFLNPDEVRAILGAAERPGEEGAAAGAEDSFGSSHDCSSGTYFPEQSDLEPPLLELGWPSFYKGAYRGATRVEAHFQPRGTGARGPYGCKDALRQQLRSAREVSVAARLFGSPRSPVRRDTPLKNGKLRSARSASRVVPGSRLAPLCVYPLGSPISSLAAPRGRGEWEESRSPRRRIVPKFQLLTFTFPGRVIRSPASYSFQLKPVVRLAVSQL